MKHYSVFIKLSLILFFSAINFIGCGHSTKEAMSSSSSSSMTFSSSAFSNMAAMPIRFASNEGGTLNSDYFRNFSPPLQWSGTPQNAKSLVIIVWAPNASSQGYIGDDSVNWVLYIPSGSVTSLDENASALGNLPAGSIECKNRLGTNGWAGPAPSSAVPHYAYSFEIYALNTFLSLNSSSTKADVVNAMSNNIINQNSFVGLFSRMTLSTNAFANNGFIPVGYTLSPGTADGKGNANPQLTWTNIPSGTKSLVLLLDDISLDPVKNHWVVYNIPSVYTNFPAGGDNARPHPPGSTYGTNDWTSSGHAIDYFGPNPPSGQLDTYAFKLYAVDTTLDAYQYGHATKTQILNAINGHILNEAEYYGKYISLELTCPTLTWDATREVWRFPHYTGLFYGNYNPPLYWNSAGIPTWDTAKPPMTLVLLMTAMTGGTVGSDTYLKEFEDERNWMVYIPQVDGDPTNELYGRVQIQEGLSWSIGFPGEWVQGLGKTRSITTELPDNIRGIFGPDPANSNGLYYKLTLFVMASTLGVTLKDEYDAFYSAVYNSSTNIINKATLYGFYTTQD